MEERYRTPNGNILTRNELISQYGESKFQGFLEKGKITLVEDDQNSDSEVEFEDNGEVFITPNGNELTSTELVSQYGAEKFKSFLSDGKIKKKGQSELGSQSDFSIGKSEQTEQDYFTGAFGDALRGLDSIIPIGIGDFVDDMARAVAGGVNQGISSENASDLLLRGSMSTDEDIASYIESQKTAQKIGSSQEMMDYEKIYNEEGKGFWGVVKGLMFNPTVLPELIVSSMSALASNSDALLAGAATIGTGATYGAGVGVLAGGVGAGPGSIAGATAAIPYAFGVASSTLEMGATFGELLQEELGDKEFNKENVRDILNDPDKLQSIRNKAVARGIVIGTIDAFTGKLASGVGAKILTKSAAKSATNVAAKSAIVKSTAAGSAIEAAGGSIGEIGGRLVAGQEMDTSEILLEGLAELPGGVRSTITAQLQRPQYKVNGKIESVETVDNLIATMTPAQLAVSNIEIKNDKARQVEVQKKVVKGKTLQDVKEANPELNDATADAIADIEIQIDALSSNLTQSGRAKRTALKEQIKNLQENQIQEEAAVDVAETVAAEEADVDAVDQPITAEDVVDEQAATEAKDDSSPITVESIVDDVTGEVKPVTEEMVSEADALEGDLGSAYADILSETPEATTETPNEIVYEMNKTDKKIWSKDFEIIDNRNGEEDAEGAKWMVRNVVTGYMMDAKSKKDAQYIIDNAPAEAELFGEGEKVEIDTEPEITNVNKELESDLDYYFGKIEDIQDEINNERAVKKADVAELKSKLAEVRKDKTLSRDEKVERIEDIKAEIDDFIENQDMVIGDLKLDLDDAKKQAKSTQRKIDKQKTAVSSKTQDAKFRLQEEGDDATTVDARDYDLDAISMEMLELGGGEMNFTVPLPEGVTLSPIGESKSSTKLTDSDAKEIGFEKVSDMEKPIEYFEDIPMLKAISDILGGGTYKDAVGNDLKIKGGMMFNAIAKVKAAWAGVKKSVSNAQYKNAVKLYNVHKDLFDRLWKEGRLPDGHIPMAIIRMANDAVLSNEAVFRYLVPEIKNQSIKNQTAAMNDLIEGFKTKAAPQNKKILKFISDKKITNLGQFLDEIVLDATERAKGDVDKTLTLDERTVISKNLLSLGDVDAPAKKFLKSLYNGSKKDNSKIFIANNIYQAIGEPAMLKTKKGDVVSIVGIDVKNGGVIDIDHPNYGTGPAGRLIALITNPKNGINVFPEWRAKASRVFKKSKSAKGDGKAPSQSNLLNQVMGTAANDLAFQGSAVTSEMTDMKILLGKLRFAFPNVGVLTTKQDFDAILKQPGVRTKMSEGKVILGLTIDGKVYINPETSSLATPIHEFGHIWIDFLRSKQGGAKGAALLKRGLKLVEGTQALKTAIEKYGDNKLAREEALVELMATKGEDLIGESKKSFKEWMNGVFKYIKAKFVSTEVLFKKEQIKKLNAEKKEINKKAKITDADKKRIQEIEAEVKAIDASAISSINKMSLDDFINAGLADLFKGSVVSKSFDPKAASQGGMARYELGDSVSNFIADAKEKGYSNDAIRLVLERRGVDKNKITEAFQNVVDAVAQDNTEIAALTASVQAVVDRRVSRGGDVTRMIAKIDKIVRDSDIYKRSDDATKRMLEANARAQADVQQKRAPSIGRIIAAITDIANITSADKLKIANSIIQLAKTAQKELGLELKGMATKGTITVAQQTAIMNRMLKVNFLNETSISNFVSYMANVFKDVEYATKISTANAKRKVAKDNASKKIGVLQALSTNLQRIFSINPTLIPQEVLNEYMSLINLFGKRETVLSLPDLETVTTLTNKVLDSINEEQSLVPQLQEKYNSYNKVMNDNGNVDYAATIKAMLKDEIITEADYELMIKYKSSIVSKTPAIEMSDQEIEIEKAKVIRDIISGLDDNERELPTRLEREAAIELRRLAKTEALNGLSLIDLKNLYKVFDNISNGYLPHMAEVMIQKLNSVSEGKNLGNAIQRGRTLPVSRIYATLKNFVIRGKGSIVEMIRRNPLFNIDQIFGDFKTKDIFNAILEKPAKAVAQFVSSFNTIQRQIEKAQTKVRESLGKDGNKYIESSYKQMAWMIQNEFLTNPLSNQVNSVDKWLKATIKRIDSGTSQFSIKDAEMLQNILTKYYDSETKIFNNEALYDSFNDAEKNSIEVISQINLSLTEKANYTKSVIRGEKFVPLNNYVHLNVLHQSDASDVIAGPSAAANFNNSTRVSTRANNLEYRTGKVSPDGINFNVYDSVLKGAKTTLMDFHLTSPLKTSRMTLNRAEKNLEIDGRIPNKQRKIFNAINLAFEESVSNLLENTYQENSLGEATLEYLKKTGYRTILAGSGRFVAELTSNLSYAMLVDPKGFIVGTNVMRSITAEQGPQIARNLGWKNQGRLYSDGLSGRMIDTSILNQVAGSKTKGASSGATNFLRKYWNKTGQKWVKGVEVVADGMISTPDKLVMRPITFGSFDVEFKKITGESPDYTKIAENDEAYMNANKSALDAASDYADKKSVFAGATDNAFMGILKGTSKPNQSGFVKGFNAFNNFMTRFLIYEYVTARTGIYNMVGRGDLSLRQGAALLGGVTSRMVLYTLIGQYLSHALTDLFGDDDELEYDENWNLIENPEEMKDFEKVLGQSFVSAFTSMFFGRDFGNATKSIVNWGLEEFNKEHLDFLRNGEYDQYRDAIQYTITPKEKTSGGTGLADYLLLMGGAYGPIVKTGDLIVQKISEPVKTTPEARKRQEDEIYKRIPLEILGELGFIPLYKDIRKVVLDKIYKDLKNAQAELKSSQADKKIREEMLQGYDSETDLKRYDRALWEETFGPNSPGFDKRQAEKSLKAAERKIQKQLKDDLYDYTPTPKTKSAWNLNKSSSSWNENKNKSSWNN